VDEESGLNALQLYVQNFKQADLTLTGTVRKATLVNQSTKVLNPVPAGPPPGRKSTHASTNGRNSISNTKLEEGFAGHGIISSTELEKKKCITCGIDVSPKWWPMTSARPDVQHLAGSIEQDHGSVNGNMDHASINGGSHVALAAAALHQDTHIPPSAPTEFQCHQCHWKKLRKEPSPPPIPSPREASRPVIASPPAPSAPSIEPEVIHTIPPYSWPQPPPYTNGPYSTWPRQSPTPANVPVVNQLNGNHHSPRLNTGPPQQLNGSSQPRQPSMQVLQHSPHQNGRNPPPQNGYPPSPHRSSITSSIHVQNGPYPSYASTRPLPQHLTNGGPPPRAPEQPFSHSNAPPIHSRPYGPPHSSPPMHRETHPQSRDPANTQSNGVRQGDPVRVNGGASASPSLRNLLS